METGLHLQNLAWALRNTVRGNTENCLNQSNSGTLQKPLGSLRLSSYEETPWGRCWGWLL